MAELEESKTSAQNQRLMDAPEVRILPMSYAMPLATVRFASPAASIHLPQALLALFFGRERK